MKTSPPLSTGDSVVATVDVTNTGRRAGADVVQVYVGGEGWEAPQRLGGFAKVDLQPGEHRLVVIPIDPRLLAVWDADSPGWNRKTGVYTVTVGHSSRDLGEVRRIELPALRLPPTWKPER
jgi:beta-glucosidase